MTDTLLTSRVSVMFYSLVAANMAFAQSGNDDKAREARDRANQKYLANVARAAGLHAAATSFVSFILVNIYIYF